MITIINEQMINEEYDKFMNTILSLSKKEQLKHSNDIKFCTYLKGYMLFNLQDDMYQTLELLATMMLFTKMTNKLFFKYMIDNMGDYINTLSYDNYEELSIYLLYVYINHYYKER